MSLRAKCAIAGLGQTRMGKNFDHPGPIGFAAEAVNLALDDAGLQRADVDGLLVNPGITWLNNPMASSSLQHAMGLRDLRLTATMNLGGATAAAMIMHAAQAIDAGMAEVVACVFADAPLRPPSPNKGSDGGSAAFYGFARVSTRTTACSASTPIMPSSPSAICIATGPPTIISARSRCPSAIGPT